MEAEKQTKHAFLASDLFTQKQVLGMLAPLILDKLAVYAIMLLTTSMISASGEDSVSAVSLVTPISHLALALFSAFGTGGAVIIAQYKGHGDEEKLKEAIAQTFWLVMVSGLVLSLILLAFARPIVLGLFASAEPSVKQKAVLFLSGMAINNFMHAARVASSAALLGSGEIKTNMQGSILINVSYFVFSFVMLNLLKLDIAGTLISYFLARLLGALHSFYCLFWNPHSRVRVPFTSALKPIKSYLVAIGKLGLPFSAEEIFFNGGTVVVSAIVVLLGTVSVAANAIVTSVFNTIFAPIMAVGMLSTTIIGQCIGAERKDLARRYGRELILLGYLLCLLTLLVMLPLMKPVLSIYHPSAEALPLVWRLIWIGAAGTMLLYAPSCIFPYVLKAAGDAYYSTVVALVAMWGLRVGMGYVLGICLKMGMEGIWLMMAGEYLVRTILFYLRYRGQKWLQKSRIDTAK